MVLVTTLADAAAMAGAILSYKLLKAELASDRAAAEQQQRRLRVRTRSRW